MSRTEPDDLDPWEFRILLGTKLRKTLVISGALFASAPPNGDHLDQRAAIAARPVALHCVCHYIEVRMPPPSDPDHHLLSRDCGRLSLVALVVLTSSLVACLRDSDDDATPEAVGEAADFGPPATSLDDLVRRAEVIVVARVEAIVDSGERSVVEGTPSPGAPPFPKLAYTDYALRIDRVVSGGVAAAGERIVLRVGARPGDRLLVDGLRVPRAGDRRLFILEHPRTAEGYYILSVPGSIYRIDRTPVTLDDVDDTSVAAFTTAVTPAAFEDALRQAMQARGSQ